MSSKFDEHYRCTQNKHIHIQIWCDFDRASPLICGNKMPTRCNRWFLYCRSYCLLNVFRAPVCPSSCPVCGMLQNPANQTHNPELYTRPTTWKPKHQTPQAATTCIILLSSWWWAQWCPKHVEQAIRSAVKKPSVASSWHFISTYTHTFKILAIKYYSTHRYIISWIIQDVSRL